MKVEKFYWKIEKSLDEYNVILKLKIGEISLEKVSFKKNNESSKILLKIERKILLKNRKESQRIQYNFEIKNSWDFTEKLQNFRQT